MAIRNYSVKAQIVSGINDSTVWEGTLLVQSLNKKGVTTAARQKAEDTITEFDPRIDPSLRVIEIQLQP